MRYRRVHISGVFLVHLMEEGWKGAAKCINGLPRGTKFCYSIPEDHFGIHIVIEHESFALLKDGDLIPIHEPKPEWIQLPISNQGVSK